MAKNFGGAFGGAIRSTIVAAGLIAAVVIYSDRSGRSPVALEAYVPHKGALFDMERRQLSSMKPARDTFLAELPHPSGGWHAREKAHASSWAQALLQRGSSHAESQDAPARSLVTRGYSNNHAGYTSSLPEAREGGDGDAYDFASALEAGRPHTRRRIAKQLAPAQTQALADAYAQRALSRGRSVAEGNDTPSRSLYSRSSRARSGYTTAVPEAREGGDGDAYDFAASISHDRTSRSDKAREISLTEIPAGRQPPSVYSRSSRARGGYTTAVPEAREGGDGDAYDFAASISHDRTSRSDKARATSLSEEAAPHSEESGARTTAIRESRARGTTQAWAFGGDLEDAKSRLPVDDSHAIRGRGGRSSLAEAHRRGGAMTSAIAESRDSAEEHAWDWAASQFDDDARPRHRAPTANQAKQQVKRAAPAPVVVVPAPVTQVTTPEAAPAVTVEVVKVQKRARQTKGSYEEQERQARRALRTKKISAARKAVTDLHDATTKLDHEAFQAKQTREKRRTAAVAARERAEEHAANQGARDEVAQYAAISAMGVPSGKGASFTTDETGLGAACRRGGHINVGATKLADKEEASYSKGFEAGLAAEQKSAGAQRSLAREARAEAVARVAAKRDAVKKAAATKKATEEKAAREQSLADNTWDDADSDFQVDGGQWGPGGGDWA